MLHACPAQLDKKKSGKAYMQSLIELVEPFPTDTQESPSVTKRENVYIIGDSACHMTEFDLSQLLHF
jgi:hypothetical protein